MLVRDEQVRAKVFISCGQWEGDERETADKIKVELESLGFEGYVATRVQSLRGVQQNIFQELQTAEYFLFVDFKREELDGTGECRGSLFSHQELALASSLGLDVVVFQENGTKPEDGLLRFIQANPAKFTDRHSLPLVVIDAIKRRGWRPDWKNQLVFADDPVERNTARITDTQQIADFFGISISNPHQSKPAMNCYVYLEKVRRISNGDILPLRTIELHWAAYPFPNALIGPKAQRVFDAFMVFHDNPTVLHVPSFATAGLYAMSISGPGDFEFTYTIVSENFPIIRKVFEAHVGKELTDISLRPAGCSP